MAGKVHRGIAVGLGAGLSLAVIAFSSPLAVGKTTTLGPGDLVSETALQHALPRAQVVETKIDTSLSGAAGSTLATFCGARFASETRRQAREQVWFTVPEQGVPGGRVIEASNEVVSYSSNGADEAYNELKRAVARCPKSYHDPQGDTYIHNTAAKPSAGLAAHSVVETQFISQQPGSPARVWEVNVFQFDGNYLSAIYTFDPNEAIAKYEATSLASAARANLTNLAQ